MKHLFFVFVFLGTMSCKEASSNGVEYTPKLASFTSQTIEKAIIYEANIRQYSDEGTFEAFTKEIPHLKEMGVNIIWLMPIHPISQIKKKGKFGSPYSVNDFKMVNPEYGTMKDFDSLVETAHSFGIYVIMDWVANQTGWEHRWIREHPDYYVRNEKGEIQGPSNSKTGGSWGWTDVAELNYDNRELRSAMIQEMLYWVKNHGIDGYRMGTVQEVPTDFWQVAIDSLKKEKDDFLVIETEKSEETSALFEMHYDYTAQQLMNSIAIEKRSVADWDAYFKTKNKTNNPDIILINFTSNHDENAWNGTVYERLGKAAETFAALTYLMPGVPLIYNGQEYENKKRLIFFDKDSFAHTKGHFYELYQKLGKLKISHPALSASVEKGVYKRIQSSKDNNVLAFWRTNGNDSIMFVANLNKEPSTFSLFISGGTYEDYFSGSTFNFQSGTTVDFKPWEYKVLIKQ